MRYIIFSDIHSNLEALESFKKLIKEFDYQQLLFLGDFVGYGPNPVEVLSIMNSMPVTALAGNHDLAVAGALKPIFFNSMARAAIDWSRKIINTADKEFLKELPLTFKAEDFICSHGCFKEPARFSYIFNSNDALVNFRHFKQKLGFVGHTHIAGVFQQTKSGVKPVSANPVYLNKNYRYIINVGSIGQPRDRNPQGSFCVYDSDKASVEFIRFDYEKEKTASKIIKQGLPPFLGQRLKLGR
jgi:predicted phosphodiesterase